MKFYQHNIYLEFVLNPTHFNLHLVNNLSFQYAFNSPKDVSNFR
jgi:hypothetical protein